MGLLLGYVLPSCVGAAAVFGAALGGLLFLFCSWAVLLAFPVAVCLPPDLGWLVVRLELLFSRFWVVFGANWFWLLQIGLSGFQLGGFGVDAADAAGWLC